MEKGRQNAQGLPRSNPYEWLSEIQVTYRNKNGILQKRVGLPEDMIQLLIEEDKRKGRN